MLPIRVELLASPDRIAARAPLGVLVVVDPLGGGAAVLRTLDDAGTITNGELASTAPAAADVALAALRAGWQHVLLADLANARPACAHIAGKPEVAEGITFAARAADGVFVAGVLVRTLLEELDRPAALDDGAGIAVAVAGSTVDLRAGLLLSERGRVLEAAEPAAVSAAAQLDLIGVTGGFELVDEDRVALRVSLPSEQHGESPDEAARRDGEPAS